MKILFVGSGTFGLPTLEALRKSSHNVVGIVTQPLRPRGRGRKIKEQPIESRARELGLKVLAPEKVNAPDSLAQIARLVPDVIVVAAYGALLSKAFVASARKECVNLHPSLLPKYRGAAPIVAAILAGEKEIGITLLRLSQELDAGDILLQEKIPLGNDENAPDVTKHLAGIGAKLVIRALDLIERGELTASPQDHRLATYVPKLKKEDARVDWSKKALEIHNQVRAYYEWPGSFTCVGDKALKILKTHVAADRADEKPEPGTVLEISRLEGIRVQAGEGSLFIERLQIEGGRPMDHRSFLNGHPLRAGFRFG